MVAGVSAVSYVLAVTDGGDVVAAFAHVVAPGRQRIVLADHPTCRCGTPAQCFEPYARLYSCLFGAAALRHLDCCAAADRGERRDLEHQDNSHCPSFARFSETDRRNFDLRLVRSCAVMAWLLC